LLVTVNKNSPDEQCCSLNDYKNQDFLKPAKMSQQSQSELRGTAGAGHTSTGKERQKQLLRGTQNELIPVKIDAGPSEANNCVNIREQCPITGSK
jgi:hypothetical protein